MSVTWNNWTDSLYIAWADALQWAIHRFLLYNRDTVLTIDAKHNFSKLTPDNYNGFFDTYSLMLLLPLQLLYARKYMKMQMKMSLRLKKNRKVIDGCHSASFSMKVGDFVLLRNTKIIIEKMKYFLVLD